jgi:formylglycine-generating enzyme required for sulfatase activity
MFKKNTNVFVLICLVVLLLAACASQSPQVSAAPVQEDPAAVPTQAPPAEEAAAAEPASPAGEAQADEPASQPAVSATPAESTTRTSEKDQMVEIFIPAGEFIMGSDSPESKQGIPGGRAYPEGPQHTVTLPGYWIDKFEVTNRQYALCVADGACNPPEVNYSASHEHYFDSPEFADYPVIFVSWFSAQSYCKWTGRRLPTEAEWEKAARGTDGRLYPWGNDPISGEYANFCDSVCLRTHANPAYYDGYPETAPVGSFPKGASPYGLMDMAGNVWEWTSTVPNPYPYDALDGREDSPGFEQVWRGGPWSNGTWYQRASTRYRSVPIYRYFNLGFRCAASE